MRAVRDGNGSRGRLVAQREMRNALCVMRRCCGELAEIVERVLLVIYFFEYLLGRVCFYALSYRIMSFFYLNNRTGLKQCSLQ